MDCPGFDANRSLAYLSALLAVIGEPPFPVVCCFFDTIGQDHDMSTEIGRREFVLKFPDRSDMLPSAIKMEI
jgi:hypothetical protein